AVADGPRLIRPALARPTLPGTMVQRPRLVSQLEPTPACRLALVVAPAGAGKSSLLSEWCDAHPGARIAWISLDANDNEPLRFLFSLSAALEWVAPEVAEPVRALLEAPEPPSIDDAQALLLNSLSALQHPVTLILDDYDAIEAPPVHRLLAYLLGRLPPPLFLIIATRSDP